MYQVTQHNADTGETFTGTGRTVSEALVQVVSNGQASTQHRAEDATWLDLLTGTLREVGEATRGFARYNLSDAVPVGTLNEGDEGTVTEGKFQGRRFRIRSVGATGRTVWLDWTGHGTNGVVGAGTLVTR